MPDLPAWIQEIRDRVDKATPGPWTAEDANPHKPHKRFAFYIPEIMSAPSMPQYDGLTEEDTDFIAHARTDVPRLVELVGEMAETLDEMAPSYALEKGCFFPEDCTTCAELNRHNCPGYMAERVRRKYRGEEDKP